MDGDVRATAQLLTSELVTNAMEHGSGAIVLRLAATDHTLRVEVADDSVQEPKLQAENTELLSGRGLRLVDALAPGWGVAPATSGGGKLVWFTLRVPPMH
jgi:anti-sigma regulatory factor (Ser/Thr protein kinase)